MRILLTGATGFLGQHLCEALLAEGHGVRALVRRPAPHLQALGVETVIASLHDSASLIPQLRGIETVIHAAGGGKVSRVEDFYAQNSDTTAQLVQAASRAGIGHFLLVSSLAARGPDQAAAKHTPADRPTSHYGRSKLLAERIALRQKAFPVTILRPPGIYGPGDTRFALLYRQVRRGLVPLPAQADSLSLIWGPDCARALTSLLQAPAQSGGIWYASDGSVHSSAEIMSGIAAALGKRPRSLPVPLAAISALASLSSAYSRISGQPGFLTPDKIRDLRQARWTCSPEALSRATGWKPAVTLPEGLAQLAHWYQAQGWI